MQSVSRTGQWMAALTTSASLMACGGGGGASDSGTASVSAAASAAAASAAASSAAAAIAVAAAASATAARAAVVKSAAEALADSAGGVYRLDSSLPAKGVAINDTHWAFSLRSALAATPGASAQRVDSLVDSLSTTWPLPNLDQRLPTRVLVKGDVLTAASIPGSVNEQSMLLDEYLVTQTLAMDDSTALYRTRLSSFETVSLTGAITSPTGDLKSVPFMSAIAANTALLKAKPTYLTGSAYFKRRDVAAGDTVFVENCATPAPLSTELVPCPGLTTLESVFPHSYDTALYTLGNGKIVDNLQGVRAWVSLAAMPASIKMTESYLVFFEWNNGVYRGTLVRDGTALKQRAADGSVIDYGISFNQKAVMSLKATVAF